MQNAENRRRADELSPMGELMRVLVSVMIVALLAGCRTASPRPGDKTPLPSGPTAATAARELEPQPAPEDPIGLSVEGAVLVPKEAPDHGIPFENDWIFDRFGKFRRTFGGLAQKDGRHYDLVKVELWSDHSEKTIYFDITENWNAWTPEKH